MKKKIPKKVLCYSCKYKSYCPNVIYYLNAKSIILPISIQDCKDLSEITILGLTIHRSKSYEKNDV